MKNNLELLQKISVAETPPFLLTRIKQRIQSLADVPAPVQWKWAFAVVAILIVLLNSSVLLSNKSGRQTDSLDALSTTMNLSTSNDLYHD